MLEDFSKSISTVASMPGFDSARKRNSTRGLTNKDQNMRIVFNCTNYNDDYVNSDLISIINLRDFSDCRVKVTIAGHIESLI